MNLVWIQLISVPMPSCLEAMGIGGKNPPVLQGPRMGKRCAAKAKVVTCKWAYFLRWLVAGVPSMQIRRDSALLECGLYFCGREGIRGGAFGGAVVEHWQPARTLDIQSPCLHCTVTAQAPNKCIWNCCIEIGVPSIDDHMHPSFAMCLGPVRGARWMGIVWRDVCKQRTGAGTVG